MKIRHFGMGLAVTLVLVAIAGSAILCNATLRVPRRVATRTPAFAEATTQEVALRARDGVALRAWFFTPEQTSGRCVVILHGIGDSRVSAAGFAPMFLKRGYSVLTPDSRGHGESGGEFVTYGLLEKFDVVDWVGWLRSKGCTQVDGLGESLGASILIQAAGTAPVFHAIVAECAYSDLRSIGAYRVHEIIPAPVLPDIAIASGMVYARVRYGLDLAGVSAVDAIRRTTTPVLLIHGMDDRRTPPWHSQALMAASQRATLWLVPHAGHTAAYSTDPAEFERRVLAFTK